jgi:N-ethylmaleimide reductase
MNLFSPLKIGNLTLKNRIVMAPMTRSRAIGNIPNALMAEHYANRADAGLLITEGTSPSPNGLGYARIPGLFSKEQVNGWNQVTKAVKGRGGNIFVQLMHTGRVSHPLNMAKDAKILAPSALAVSGEMWTDQEGKKPHPNPKEMTGEEIQMTIKEYITSAALAMEAGFDGVELHAANGYLIEQFLNPKSNHRKDRYGASSDDRKRFLLEIAEGAARRIGAKKIGVRISPYGVFNDMGEFSGVEEFYASLSKELSELGLAYIHVVDHSAMGAPKVSDEIKEKIRKNFQGAYILSGGYGNVARAEKDISEGRGDLVAFGRTFIGNADLVSKLKNHQELKAPDFSKFYTAGSEGYLP